MEVHASLRHVIMPLCTTERKEGRLDCFFFFLTFFALVCTWHITSSQSVYHTEPKKGTRKLLTAEEAWEILVWRKRKNVNTGYWREKVRKSLEEEERRVALRKGESNWGKRVERKLGKLKKEEKLRGKEYSEARRMWVGCREVGTREREGIWKKRG